MTPENQLTAEELAKRADEAERLLHDPLLQEALANLRVAYFEEWLNTSPEDARARESLYMASRAVSHVETHLRIVASRRPIDGKLDALKKMQTARRETLHRDAPARAGNAAAV